MPGSPFTVAVSPGPANVGSTVSGAGLTAATANVGASFTITAVDGNSNLLAISGGAVFDVVMAGPSPSTSTTSEYNNRGNNLQYSWYSCVMSSSTFKC